MMLGQRILSVSALLALFLAFVDFAGAEEESQGVDFTFGQMDTDKDGLISKEELKHFIVVEVGEGQELNEDQVKEAMEAFDAGDIDKDGLLSHDEMAALSEDEDYGEGEDESDKLET